LSFYGKEKKIIRDAIDEMHCCEKHDDHTHDVSHELSRVGNGKDSCELQVSMKETAGCQDSEEPVCIRTKDARSPDLSVDVHSRTVFYTWPYPREKKGAKASDYSEFYSIT
jgi:hypothetical protein